MRATLVTALCCSLGACGFSAAPGVGLGEAGVDTSPPLDTTVDPDAAIPDAPPDANLVTTGLVAWYQMETLSLIEDSTGNGHTGTCTSCPTMVAGKIGNGFRFDGGQNRINVASTNALNTTTAFTVAFWVRFEMLPGSGYSCPVGKYFGSMSSNSWQLCYDAMMTSWFYGTAVGGTFPIHRRMPGPVVNTWYHAAITWDGTTKRIWLDGTADEGQAATGISFDTMPVTLGADLANNMQNAAFRGVLDDVRIYNRLLTGAELALLAAM